MPVTISQFRQEHPEYNDMSDPDLTSALHKKFYSDIPYDDFAAKFAPEGESTSSPSGISYARSEAVPAPPTTAGYKVPPAVQGERDAKQAALLKDEYANVGAEQPADMQGQARAAIGKELAQKGATPPAVAAPQPAAPAAAPAQDSGPPSEFYGAEGVPPGEEPKVAQTAGNAPQNQDSGEPQGKLSIAGHAAKASFHHIVSGIGDAMWAAANNPPETSMNADPVSSSAQYGFSKLSQFVLDYDPEKKEYARPQFAKEYANLARAEDPKVKELSGTDAWNQGKFGDWITAQAGGLAGPTALTIAGIIEPELMPAVLTTFGVTSGGNQYASDREAGVDNRDAARDAVINGAINTVAPALSTVVAKVASPAIMSFIKALPQQGADEIARQLIVKGLATMGVTAGAALTEGTAQSLAQLGMNASQKYVAGRDDTNLDDNMGAAFVSGALPAVAHVATGVAKDSAGAVKDRLTPATPEEQVGTIIDQALSKAADAKNLNEAQDIINQAKIDAKRIDPRYGVSHDETPRVPPEQPKAADEQPKKAEGASTPDDITGSDVNSDELAKQFKDQQPDETPKPAEPAKEEEPAKPAEPVKPAEPDKPVEPVEAVKPAEPEAPTKPKDDKAGLRYGSKDDVSVPSEERADVVDAANSYLSALGKPTMAPGEMKFVTPPKHVEPMVRAVKKAFGVDVRFVDSPQLAGVAQGFKVQGMPKSIYISTKHTSPLQFTLGHELLHAMREQHPDLYAPLMRKLKANLKNEPLAAGIHAHQHSTKLDAKTKAGILKSFNMDRGDGGGSKLHEEMIADYVGRRFSDPKFWDDLAGHHPVAFKKFAEVARKLLDRLLKAFGSLEHNRPTDFVEDTQRARDAVNDALIKWQGRTAQDEGTSSAKKGKGDLVAEKKDEPFFKEMHPKDEEPPHRPTKVEYGDELEPDHIPEWAYDDKGDESFAQQPDLSNVRPVDPFQSNTSTKNLTEVVKKLNHIEGGNAMNEGNFMQAWQAHKKDGEWEPFQINKNSYKITEDGNIEVAHASTWGNKLQLLHAQKVLAAKTAEDALKLVQPKAIEPPKNVEPPHHQKINSPEFKAWFGDSKAVDKDGKPMIFYHGTAADFESFKAKQAGAFFVTPNRAFASNFADFSQRFMDRNMPKGNIHGRNIIAMYVRAEKPFDYTNKAHINQLATHLEKMFPGQRSIDLHTTKGISEGAFTPVEILRNVERGVWQTIESREVMAFVKGHFDSMWVYEDLGTAASRNLAVFHPNQIKSIYNKGTFSRKLNAMHLEPQEPHELTAATVGRMFRLDDASNADKFQRKFVDRFNRVLDVQDMIAAQGGTVSDANNIYRALERYPGRTDARVQEFHDKVLQPLIADAAKRKVTLDDAIKYLYAKHAEERNVQIAKINPRMPDAGSGITTQEAQNRLAAFRARPDFTDIEHVARRLQDITNGTADLLTHEDLLSPAERQKWAGAYKDYVPLRGKDTFDVDDFDTGGSGRGYDIRGTESARAMGRYTEADPAQILGNIIADHFQAIVRAEKNKIGKRLMKFVLDNPDGGLWQIDELKKVRSIVDGQVHEKFSVDRDRDTLVTKVNGIEYAIKIHDPELARQLTGAFSDKLDPILLQASKFNRGLVKMWTQYNPTFTARNFMRDASTGMIHTVAEHGIKRAAQIAAYTPSAIRAMWQYEQGKRTGSNMLSYTRSYVENGGRTGYVDFKKMQDHLEEAQRLYQDAQSTANPLKLSMRGIRWLGSVVSDANGAIENGIRIASYRAAIESGHSVDEATSIAKNLTVNFNRRGDLAPSLNAVALFYNPTVQGNARIMQAMKRAPKAMAAIVGAQVGIGMALAWLSSQDSDEDGTPYWYKPQAEQAKSKNLVLVLPGTKGKMVTIPVPYGYNVFFQLGYSLHDLLAGKKSPLKVAWELTGAAIQGWAPVGGNVADGGWTAAIPNVAQLPARIEGNTDDFGNQLLPGDDQRPDSERFKAPTRGTQIQHFTSWLNQVTGGDAHTPGMVSVSPETVNYLIHFVTGGLGTFMSDGLETMAEVIGGNGVDPTKVPFLKDYYREHDPERDSKLFYDRMKDLQHAVASVKEATDKGDDGRASALKSRYGEALLENVGGAINEYKQALKELRDEEAEVRDSEEPSGVKTVRIKEIGKRRGQVYREFNRLFNDNSGGKLSVGLPPQLL